MQTLRDRDTWAIFKLWTNWPTPCDLRLEVAGGHLYRRGSYAQLSEAGAVTGPSLRETHRKGQVEEITLRIGGVDKRTTGYQLALTLPDKDTETSLRDFYGSVLNGGAVNDQKGFDFGNETDGWYYAGSCWMYGATLAAGVPAAGRLSAHPYDAAQAFREHLAHIFSVVDERGRAHFGYNQGGEWVDDNLHTIIGAHFYLLHSGDLAFIRECLPAMERMLGYFVERRNPQGLFKLDDVGAHWYYDAITTGGINGYYNAFFYKAALDLAEMEARRRAPGAGPAVSRTGRIDQDGVQPSALEGRRARWAALPRLDRRARAGSLLLLRFVPVAADRRGDRLARAGPQDRRHRRCPHRRNWKRSTATRATRACRPCGRCRSISIRSTGKPTADT